jgi:hypothetical protein
MVTQKYKKIVLHNEGYITTQREPGDPVRIIGLVRINRSVWSKTPEEKMILKIAKAQAKLDLKR